MNPSKVLLLYLIDVLRDYQFWDIMLWLFFHNANYDIFSVPIIQSITRLRPKNECIELIKKILLANDETTTFFYVHAL